MTESKLQLFKKHINYYQKLLGLQRWHITCKIGKLDDDDAYAEVVWGVPSYDAVITLDTKTVGAEIKRSACHECLELLFIDVTLLGQQLDVSYVKLNSIVHPIIRTLEDLL